MLSLTSLLKDETAECLNEDQKISFYLVGKAGNKIVRTADFLLNLSKIQAGSNISIQKQFDLYSDILSNLVVKYKKIAVEKGLKLTIKFQTQDNSL
jgi:hypothetical protein